MQRVELKPMDQHQRGFSLIELMITVAIVGVLAGIVVPSYLSYVQRTALDGC